ncbi:hypothetical protein BDW72DRAFT_168149 [Aspergillus terricola var. indicus]
MTDNGPVDPSRRHKRLFTYLYSIISINTLGSFARKALRHGEWSLVITQWTTQSAAGNQGLYTQNLVTFSTIRCRGLVV